MNLTTVISAVKARCASFGSRVAGAAEFKVLPEAANLTVPAAYVLPLDDNPGQNRSSTGYRQPLRESFAVVVVLSNTSDERGQAAVASVHSLRAELWAALLGWQHDADAGPLEYEGGSLLHLDRARLYYQFEFGADIEIGIAQTWQGASLAALPDLTEVQIKVDAIDPFDPNTGTSGPDGKIEAGATVAVPQT
jgi:hypothetical protein